MRAIISGVCASLLLAGSPAHASTPMRPSALPRYRDCGDWLDPGELGKYSLIIMTQLNTGHQPGKLTPEQHEQVRSYLREGGRILLHGSAPIYLCGRIPGTR